MSKILLVEDSADIMDLNASMLSLNGYQLLCAENLRQADELLSTQEPDLIVLDILLPDGNGVDWCRELKRRRSIPVLFLSALNENDDVVAGLRAGGDDYLAKPYGLDVLLARVELALRRAEEGKRFISFGELMLDIYSDVATYKGKDLVLSQKEFLLLLLLVRKVRKGKSADRDELLCTLWGASTGRDASALYTTVSRLNAKLSACGSDLTVTAVKPAGYKLERV